MAVRPQTANQRLITASMCAAPCTIPNRENPTTSKVASVSSSFGFMPGFGSISSILIEDGIHARHDESAASSVHLQYNLDPSKRQQAPRQATMGKGKGARASICLPQPAYAPLPTRPRNRGASARFLLPAIAWEYPAWRQPAMQTRSEESAWA